RLTRPQAAGPRENAAARVRTGAVYQTRLFVEGAAQLAEQRACFRELARKPRRLGAALAGVALSGGDLGPHPPPFPLGPPSPRAPSAAARGAPLSARAASSDPASSCAYCRAASVAACATSSSCSRASLCARAASNSPATAAIRRSRAAIPSRAAVSAPSRRA